MLERLNRRKICRSFLNRYNEKLYPSLFPRLIEIAILTLQKDYNKSIFTIEELEDIIYYLYVKNDYITEKDNNIQERHQLQKLKYYNDSNNNSDNFENNYDKNYNIPSSRQYRNENIYQDKVQIYPQNLEKSMKSFRSKTIEKYQSTPDLMGTLYNERIYSPHARQSSASTLYFDRRQEKEPMKVGEEKLIDKLHFKCKNPLERQKEIEKIEREEIFAQMKRKEMTIGNEKGIGISRNPSGLLRLGHHSLTGQWGGRTSQDFGPYSPTGLYTHSQTKIQQSGQKGGDNKQNNEGKKIKKINYKINYDKEFKPSGPLIKTGPDERELGGSTKFEYSDGQLSRETKGIVRKRRRRDNSNNNN